MVKSDYESTSHFQNKMNRPSTQMDSRSVRPSSSRTPRTSSDGLAGLNVGVESILNRPKTALTNCSYITKKSKSVVTEEIAELPVCRPTTSVRQRNVHSPPASQTESRPKTAPFPAKSWTQLVRDSSFHGETTSRRKTSLVTSPKNAWEECSDVTEEDECRIVLLGKAGSGKSSTGNCILNKEVFGNKSLKCRYGTAERFGKKICVVDTYGVFDQHSNKSLVPHELVKIVGMTSPGFHVVILVLAIGNISDKEHNVYREFVRHFGNDVKRRTIILFTRRDILDSDGSTIYGYVSEVPKGIQDVMEQCKRRYVAFNNNATGRERDVQVRRLLDMIENVTKLNNSRHFSSEVYGATELIMKRRMDDIKRTLQEKLRHEQDEIETQTKRLETPRSARSSFYGDETLRRELGRTKKGSRRKKSAKDESEDRLTKLPNLYFRNMDHKTKDKKIRQNHVDKIKSSRRKSSSKCEITEEEDDDFGDCDIDALKRRIEEDLSIPTVHLPSEDFVDNGVQGDNGHEVMNGTSYTSAKVLELKKRYEEQMSKYRLREKVREDCEEEQQELFQMMWKLTRYFDQSVHLNEYKS